MKTTEMFSRVWAIAVVALALHLSMGVTARAEASLRAYYPFDTGSQFTDAFGTNDLTVGSGAPAITTTSGEWKFGGGAAYFNGSSYLNFGTTISFASNEPWSVSFWYVIPTDVDGRPLEDSTAGPSQFWYRGGNANEYVYSGDAEPQLSESSPVESSYHHMVFVSYGDGYVDWYYNNTSLAPYSDKEGQSLDTMVAAGYRFPFVINRAGAGGPHFMDDLAIFDGALTAAQVGDLYSNGVQRSWMPPDVYTLEPADGATVSTPTFLKVTFNEDITTNTTGNITLTNITAGTAYIIPVGSGELVVSGAILTITPGTVLSNNSNYAVLIDTNAIKDLAEDLFAGITNATTWNFSTTTSDATAPTIQTKAPADNAIDVAVAANFVATFSEDIVAGSGNIVITNLTDGTATTIAVTNGTQVTVSGTTLTINPAAALLPGKEYAILIDNGTIEDYPAGNPFAGITSATDWNFTTKPVALRAYYPFDADFTDAFGTNDLTVGSGAPAITTTGGEWIFGGGAAYFNGSSYLNFGTTISFASNEPWSVSFWYVNPGNVDGRPLEDSTAGPSQIWYRGGNVNEYVYSGGTDPQLSESAINEVSYHHFVFVSYGDGYVDWYYNNTSLAPYADKEGPSLDTMVAAGYRFPFVINRAGAGGPHFMDDLAIFDGPLTPAMVADLYNNALNLDDWAPPPPATGTIFIFR